MKRGIKLLILFISLMLIMPNVMAASATTVISGTNTVKVGKTTKIYIKLNASSKIEGVDVSYSSSGNISVTSASIGSGLSQMGKNGNRYILYAGSPIKSGSTILTLTVKGTKEGTGTITVNKMEATVSGVTVNGGSKSYKITVKPAVTAEDAAKAAANAKKAEEEKKKKEEAAKKAAEEKAKKEAEEAAKRKSALEEATRLVEKAEKDLVDSAYDPALKAVNALPDSAEKTALLERLDAVRIKMAVNKECGNRNTDSLTCDCNTKVASSSKSWIVLCIILFICLLLETIYLVSQKMKARED